MRSLEVITHSAARGFMGAMLAAIAVTSAAAQEPLPWQKSGGSNDAYRTEQAQNTYGSGSVYRPVQSGDPDSSAGGASPGSDGVYRPRGNNDAYSPPPSSYDRDERYSAPSRGGSDAYSPPRDGGYDAPRSSGQQYGGQQYGGQQSGGPQYGEPYAPPRGGDYRDGGRYDDGRDDRYDGGPRRGGTFSEGEILRAGRGFFGSVSQGLASAVEYVFQKAGRPNGYILGEDAGGAIVAGLRYGEGRLYTKDAGEYPVYWQGPSLGYDFGAEGSKTMVLVYNLREPSEIYNRFGGVQGSAYLVGGVGVQFQKHDDVVLAPIRSGVGLRLGANVGYLKYTRKPTWNPF